MNTPRSWARWLAVVLLLALAIGLGGRWLLTRLYPLEFRAVLFEQADEHGLDPYLVAAVIRAESRFRPEATSRQGARGLMQIMPETGKWVADQMKIAFHPDLLYEPDYNVRLGSWYLAYLLNEFDGDYVLALAAYNGGHNNVEKWLRENQWTGEERTLEQIPFEETRHYVAAVLRDYQRYRWLYAE